MDRFQGWKKIYLFYGVIFFCLGGVSGFLRAPAAWREFGRGLERLVGDLRYYTTAGPEAASTAVTVAAPLSVATVVFFYPDSWTKQFPTVIWQVREVLTQNFAQVEMEAVKGKINLAVSLAAWAVKHPSQVVAAVEPDNAETPDRLVYLRWWTLASPPQTGPVKNLNRLPQRAQINVKLRQRQGFWGEISWREVGRNWAGLPTVVAVWAETMSTAGDTASGKQPL